MDNNQVKETKKAEKEPTKKDKIHALIFLAVVIVIGWFIYAIYIQPGSGPKYTATLPASQFTVVSSSKLGVTAHITNTSSKAGAPQCMVQVSDPTDSDLGTDEFTAQTIDPHQSVVVVDTLTISNHGAANITSGTISCS